MSTEELVAKAEKPYKKTTEETLKDIAKNLG